MKLRGAYTTLVFLLGCATAHVATSIVVPPARADAPTTRWEYTCFTPPKQILEDSAQISNALNQYGAEGWESMTFVWAQYNHACFKRPVGNAL